MANPTIEEVLKAGGNLKGIKGLGKTTKPLVDTLALKILGALADTPDQETRRRALEKARRMLGMR